MSQRLEHALEFTGITDTGCSRSKNEDCIAWDAKIGLAVLTDGMGGANAGEVAGQITAETVLMEVRERIDDHPYDLGTVDDGAGYNRASLMLYDSLQKANRVILRIAHDQPECTGMGTTAITALFYDNRISVGHVGDSRIYLMREGQLTQLTEDHTVVHELMKSGIYSKEEAKKSVNRNIVTRAVGVTEELKVDILERSALPGDVYLMCSDGLTDLVSDEDIQEILATENKQDDKAQRLVDMAKGYGGNDNISVILVRVLKSFQSKRSIRQRIMDRIF